MRFVAESVIRATPERVFAFHELPDALERLTPPWAGSRVIEHAASLAVGSRTVCDIRVAPLVWVRTELVHTACERPRLFVDEQIRGPFRAWRHQHIVEPAGGGAKLIDAIDFQLPLGLVARRLAPILVLPRLRRLFAWRHEATRAWCEDEYDQDDVGSAVARDTSRPGGPVDAHVCGTNDRRAGLRSAR